MRRFGAVGNSNTILAFRLLTATKAGMQAEIPVEIRYTPNLGIDDK